MKIAFMGSGGTGKTTLLHKLNEKLNLTIVPEGIRFWMKNNEYTDFKQLSLEELKRMETEVLTKKIETENNLDSFISDRSSIDYFAYTAFWIGQHHGQKEYIDGIRKTAKDHISTYDWIFILPWGKFEIEDDGLRSTKDYYQFCLQSIMENELFSNMEVDDNYEHNVRTITELDLDKRVEQILNIIGVK